jgi:hypothetical protein
MTFMRDHDFLCGIHQEAFGRQPEPIFWEDWELAEEQHRDRWIDWAINIIVNRRLLGENQ